MDTTRRGFFQTSTAAGIAAKMGSAGEATALEGLAVAGRHSMVREGPTPDFFEGMLLGNGDIGVVVTVRPDALGLHIGKEDSWDLRVSEDHYQHVLTFQELLKLWQRASDEAKRRGKPEMTSLETNIDFFQDYQKKVRSSYSKSWPRPWPCGIVWVHWDSRMVRVGRQALDISSGRYRLALEHDDLKGTRRTVNVACFVNWTTGHVSVSTDSEAPFLSVAYDPNIDPGAQLPPPRVEASSEGGFSEFTCYQHFPAIAPTEAVPEPPRSDKDRNFALCGRLAGEWRKEGHGVLFQGAKPQPFRLDLALFTPRDVADNVNHARREAERLSAVPVAQLAAETARGWRAFWSRSAVELADAELERIWYHNQYWLACCLRQGKVAPGLFGNWTSGKIGTAWHGDYHMNYNTQQIFWGVFSSNHVDQHLPYVELCENLLPLSEAYAKEKFGLPGAFFPHSAYPVPSQTIPYPVPPWGYEICETPWTVQSLWWQYLYTLDKEYLRRVYPMLRAATRFLAAYVKKEADGKYHIVPTVSPENWGATVDYRLNKDCIIDLALTEFVLKATGEASKILGLDEAERPRWKEIGENMAPYPTVQGPFGEVWTDVLNGPVEYVYNVPVTLAPVFPGEQIGLGLREDQLGIARRSARTVRLEGGNDVVYQPLIRARLGLLDLHWFKREVRYCQIPNGVVQDRTRQIGGRYRDSTSTDYMMRMGIWIENFSLPGVLNECLLQSYTGTIRLFPNTSNLGRARFRDLRAAGAFLVSATWDGKQASRVSVLSERGATLRLLNPWGKAEARVVRAKGGQVVEVRKEGDVLVAKTAPGERYQIEPRA